jgi:hypothetical protein
MFDRIDIDRLHEVIEGKIDYRQCGKTTAMLIRLAQTAELIDSQFCMYDNEILHTELACVCATSKEKYIIIRMFCSILHYFEIPFKHQHAASRVIVDKRVLIDFRTMNDIDIWAMGRIYRAIAIDHYASETISYEQQEFLEYYLARNENTEII